MRRHVPVDVRSRMRMHELLNVRSRMYMCASPPIRSHLKFPIGTRWMAIGSRQRRVAMIMVVVRPERLINTRHRLAPAPRQKPRPHRGQEVPALLDGNKRDD
jgi:hypothetical protein